MSKIQHSLHSLLTAVGLPIRPDLENPFITSISSDSRNIKKGGLFLGLPGHNVDGGIFCNDAFNSGAVAALISADAARRIPLSSCKSVVVCPEEVDKCIGKISAVFWNRPSLKLPLIGVTGTNGKTTVSYLIEHLSLTSGISTALLGTLENRWSGHAEVASHTTSFADHLQENLASALSRGAELGVMEVSSHALDQNRVYGTLFSGAVFTNLTQDHLDYHSSMESYFLAKSKLFQPPLLKQDQKICVINVDDPWGKRLANTLGNNCWRSSLSIDNQIGHDMELTIKEININDNRECTGLLITPVGEGYFTTNLLGQFNLMNLLQAVGILLLQGLPFEPLLKAVSSFSGVPGRMEWVRPDGIDLEKVPTVLVDYAHTPDGLDNALQAAKSLAKGNLVCVFGCGGDRDKAKRPLMGRIASSIADQLVITSDNPRTEEPKSILEDILKGISKTGNVVVNEDREQAIRDAILNAAPNDLVLIAGKGHENYQIIGHTKYSLDDRKTSIQAINSRFD